MFVSPTWLAYRKHPRYLEQRAAQRRFLMPSLSLFASWLNTARGKRFLHVPCHCSHPLLEQRFRCLLPLCRVGCQLGVLFIRDFKVVCHLLASSSPSARILRSLPTALSISNAARRKITLVLHKVYTTNIGLSKDVASAFPPRCKGV